MKKKSVAIIFIVILLGTIYTTIVPASIEQSNTNQFENISEEKQISDEIDKMNNQDASAIPSLLNGWTLCGPAYVESEGKGTHICLFKPKLVLNTALPSFFRIIRWWNFCRYWNPQAHTVIEPLNGKKITLDGRHAIIAGTLIYPQGVLGGIIGNILPKIEERNEFVDKLFGDPIWDWGTDFINGKPILEFLYNKSKIFQTFWNRIAIPRLIITLIYMLTIPLPLYGYYQTLDFSGISPFVLYKEL